MTDEPPPIDPGRPSDLERLTPRELEIRGEMATGTNNAAIAATLVLSERAVEKHSNSIFSKLGLSEERDVNRRVRAVLVSLSRSGGGVPSRNTQLHHPPPHH